MSRFEIFKSMKVGVTKPFRIIETNETFDGPRSRIIEGAWASWKEAADHIRKADPTIHATHELSLMMKGTNQVLHREEFYGTDVGASARLTEISNDHTPADGRGYFATIRRYGEGTFYEQIG